MGKIKEKHNKFREKLIDIIDKIVRNTSGGVEVNKKYKLDMNPGLDMVCVSKIPYVMANGESRLIDKVDSDTLVEIADTLTDFFM